MQNAFDHSLTCESDRLSVLKEYVGKHTDWFHQFRFNDGALITPGRDPSAKKLHHLCLSSSLNGLSVIDIGAYEGYFSFACEARGATRVVACDNFVWDWPDSSALPNFNAVHTAVGSHVERLNCPVERLHEMITEQFDITLFLGVLYHAPNMIQYLDNVFRVTRHCCVLESFVDNLHEAQARATIYRPAEVNNDASTWWACNLEALEIMLTRVGFKNIVFMNLWDVNTRDQHEGRSIYSQIKTGRVVLHAYK